MKTLAASKLSKPAFAALIEVLEGTHQPLGELSRRLWQSSCGNAAKIAVGASIAALLQDDLLPNPPQRLIAIYVLYDMVVSYSIPSASSESVWQRLVSSPLTIILLDLMSDGNAYPAEQLFLSHLLSHSQSNQEDLPMNGQIAKAAASALYVALEDTLRVGAPVATREIASLQRLWSESHPAPPESSFGLKPISAVVPDPDPCVVIEPSSLIDELGSVVTLEDFTPTFVRIPPPFLPIETESKELRWIDPEPLHEVVWDPEMGIKGERGAELREIISKAIKSPITEAQQNRVSQMLNEDPKLVHFCGITPRKLPELIKTNSAVAKEILLKLMSSNQKPQYLDAFLNMDMNPRSLDIVTQLSNTVPLPKDFMLTYISNCMRSCRNIPEKSLQVRMVRYLCLILKDLVKTKNVDLQNLFIEVQEFCMGYTRIREVQDLYRLLKMEGAQL